ncbi:MAG: hypothetical protein KDA55_07795 [Planctomycetales bacterium]|nr:hypothetical protein [Planctomycetales bacterium]
MRLPFLVVILCVFSHTLAVAQPPMPQTSNDADVRARLRALGAGISVTEGRSTVILSDIGFFPRYSGWSGTREDLALVTQLDDADHVEIRHCLGGGNDLKFLAGIPSLRQVTFVGQFTDQSTLAPLAHCKSLRSLVIFSLGATVDDFQSISQLEHLEQLTIAALRLDARIVDHLTGMKHLKELKLLGVGLTDKEIRELGKLPKLESLEISGRIPSDDFIDTFFDAMPNSRLIIQNREYRWEVSRR